MGKMNYINDLNTISAESPELARFIGNLIIKAKNISINSSNIAKASFRVIGSNNQILSNSSNSRIVNKHLLEEYLKFFPSLLKNKEQKTVKADEDIEIDKEHEIGEVESFDTTRNFPVECDYEQECIIKNINYTTLFKLFKLKSFAILKHAHKHNNAVFLERSFIN
jgi:hypothetical protein